MRVLRFLLTRIETHTWLIIAFGSIVSLTMERVSRLTPWLLGVPVSSSFLTLLFTYFSREIFPIRWKSIHRLIGSLPSSVQIPVTFFFAFFLLFVTAVSGYAILELIMGNVNFWQGGLLLVAFEIAINGLTLKAVESVLMKVTSNCSKIEKEEEAHESSP